MESDASKSFTPEQFQRIENEENFVELYSQRKGYQFSFFLGTFSSLFSFLEVYARLVEATKACQQLPEDDYAYWAAFRPFKVLFLAH